MLQPLRAQFCQDLFYMSIFVEQLLKPKYPTHKILNLKLRGYDFVILERLQKLIHKYLNNMNIDVCDT